MSEFDPRSARRPEPDAVLSDIADYVCDYAIDSELLGFIAALTCQLAPYITAYLPLPHPG